MVTQHLQRKSNSLRVSDLRAEICTHTCHLFFNFFLRYLTTLSFRSEQATNSPRSLNEDKVSFLFFFFFLGKRQQIHHLKIQALLQPLLELLAPVRSAFKSAHQLHFKSALPQPNSSCHNPLEMLQVPCSSCSHQLLFWIPGLSRGTQEQKATIFTSVFSPQSLSKWDQLFKLLPH